MNTIDLKEQVQRAIRSEWPAFAAAHPKLAAMLDEDVFVDGAMQSLADDPEYQEAMATADAVGAGAEAIAGVIQRLVGRFLRQLL